MYYGMIKKNDIANGEGIRTSLFVSGCRNMCKGCFQPQTWDFNYGEPFTPAVEKIIFESVSFPFVRGITILGGEPMEPENQEALLPFIKRFKEKFPEKTIWLYTGNTYEELMGIFGTSEKHLPITEELLGYVDILVDGRYVEELKSIGLRFRGSSNQRVIDMNMTRKVGSIVIWEGCKQDRQYKNIAGDNYED